MPLYSRLLLSFFLGLGIVAYLLYFLVYGDRGLLALWEIRYELQKAQACLTLLKKEYAVLENRVHLLRPCSIDYDLLEERARAVLGMGMDGDVVVVLSSQEAELQTMRPPQ